MLQRGRYGEAATALREQIAENHNSAEAHFLLGYALFAEHQPKDSLAEYTVASHLGSPSPEDLRCIALDYVLLNDNGDADHWLNESLARNDQNPEAWYDLGRVRYAQGRYESARDCFLKSLRLSPGEVKAENNLGLAYQELHQPARAMAAFRQAIALQLNAKRPSEQPLLNLATVLAERSQLDEAASLLVRAASIAPGNAAVHKQLGIVYSRQDHWDWAQEQFDLAVSADPQNPSLHFLLGQACRKNGKDGKAREELARAAALQTSPAPN
jgi:Flp pilus assembly protein TadD